MPANYAIVNVFSGNSFDWPSNATFGSVIATSKSHSQWTLLPSAGYYIITSKELCIGSGGVASRQGLDTSLWKIVKLDANSWAIINKSTGLLLAQNADIILETSQDSTLGQKIEWKLIQIANSVQKAPFLTDREASVTNGECVSPCFGGKRYSCN